MKYEVCWCGTPWFTVEAEDEKSAILAGTGKYGGGNDPNPLKLKSLGHLHLGGKTWTDGNWTYGVREIPLKTYKVEWVSEPSIAVQAESELEALKKAAPHYKKFTNDVTATEFIAPRPGSWSCWTSPKAAYGGYWNWKVEEVAPETKEPEPDDGLVSFLVSSPYVHETVKVRILGIDPALELLPIIKSWETNPKYPHLVHSKVTSLALKGTPTKSYHTLSAEKKNGKPEFATSPHMVYKFKADNGGEYYACTPWVKPNTARTQKARGIAALGSRTVAFSILPIEKVKPEHLVGKFSRPCPMRPRHGFVDSRLISNLSEAESLIAATRDADPEAEIITMPMVQALYSGIWTPGLLTVGNGNDGATQGKTSMQIPTLGEWYPWTPDGAGDEGAAAHAGLLEAAGVKESPYIELLWKDEDTEPTPVQLRDGPKLPKAVNYVPKEITVKKIIAAEGDLLAWEALMKEAKEGTVVHHPGGSLASHYAIHCVLNGVPCLIDRKPVKGEVLRAESDVREADIKKIRAGFFYAQYWEVPMQTAVRVMLAATHNITAWRGRCDFLLGLGLGCAFRLTVIAGLGEFRHHRGTEDSGLKKGGKKHSRDEVYTCYWKRPLQGITQERVQMALKSFGTPGAWGSNFGGKKWYEFLKYAPIIHNQVLSGDANQALESLNLVTNAAHNGGWGFNKFVGHAEFDYSSQNPCWSLIRVARELYQAVADCKQKNMVERLMKRTPMEIPEAKTAPTPTLKIKAPKGEPVVSFLGGSTPVKVPDAIAENLYIVACKSLSIPGKWIATCWTNAPGAPGDQAIPCSLEQAQKGLKLANEKSGELKYCIWPVFCAATIPTSGPEDLYMVQKLQHGGTEWSNTSWVPPVSIEKAYAAALHAAGMHGDYNYKITQVYQAAKPEIHVSEVAAYPSGKSFADLVKELKEEKGVRDVVAAKEEIPW
jgi:hypothetical protein